jgi:hypothetical protein
MKDQVISNIIDRLRAPDPLKELFYLFFGFTVLIVIQQIGCLKGCIINLPEDELFLKFFIAGFSYYGNAFTLLILSYITGRLLGLFPQILINTFILLNTIYERKFKNIRRTIHSNYQLEHMTLSEGTYIGNEVTNQLLNTELAQFVHTNKGVGYLAAQLEHSHTFFRLTTGAFIVWALFIHWIFGVLFFIPFIILIYITDDMESLEYEIGKHIHKRNIDNDIKK